MRWFTLGIFAVLATVAIFTDGTGGGGDSLTHFFISQSALSDPGYFFHHWGKPFFTLFSAPWTLFGFVGIKIFNILCGVLVSWFAFLIARHFKKPWAWAVPIIAFLAPAYYAYLFSGLTEPFSALVCTVAVWLLLRGKIGWGFFLASFLPFCRNEALVFFAGFGMFGLLNGHWKQLPLLAAGTVIYAIIGGFYLDNFLWIWDVPYDSGGSVYGHGNWNAFLDRLQIMLAIPGITLAGFGVVQFFRRALFLKNLDWKTEPWLIHALFFGLLATHTVAWALGIFGSAGLERVLLVVFPFLWLIMLDGLWLLKDFSQKWLRRAWVFPMVFLILQIINVATRPPSAFYYATLFSSPNETLLLDEVAPFVHEKFPDADFYILDQPSVALALGLNYIDRDVIKHWNQFSQNEIIPLGTPMVWDSYYPTTHFGISLEEVRAHPQTTELKSWQAGGWEYVVFVWE